MDEKLVATIKKIKTLSQQNHEFAREMRKMFGNPPSASVISTPLEISNDIYAIREALEIRANKSISYDFVKEQRLRDQLIIDNLRMENAILNLQLTEEERFYSFCINAFYQLENIINYYFYNTFPKIKELVSTIEQYTEQEKSEFFRYKSTGKEKNVVDIQIAHKINALCNMFFPEDTSLKFNLGYLRQVRNEGEHRSTIILQEKNGANSLYNFFKKNTFDNVRIILIKTVNAVKENIGKPIVFKTETINTIITSKLASACYIKFKDKSEQIPDKLFTKTKGKQEGDAISIVVSNGKITDIIS